ncbi:MarR family winged helix-turn-helix transcriptional regulator [Oricola sp.]|uniref:MarR family winged helix-turn-helix transcriptional regulator n=1 Tax=Oricola sp. TaxID=1979950 RepID=UPI003BA877A6
MTFKKDKSAGFLANHMARLFASGLQERISELGLAPAQFMALLELWDEDGLTQKDLVQRLDVEQATMANTLSRMQRDGLIVRRAHSEDRRAQRIFLTDKARAVRDDATQAARQQNERALQAFSEAERGQFLAFMQRAIRSMRG